GSLALRGSGTHFGQRTIDRFRQRVHHVEPLMRLILVRHAHTRTAGRILTGRTPGVRLTGEGRSQARRLADALATLQVEAVVSSPLERALETADAIAKARSLRVEAREAWTELDFGEWTNRVISGLDDAPRWREWNSARETARIP